MQLLTDLHGERERQGPGSREATQRAIELAGLDGRTALRIADLGCGTGASTLELARLPGAHVCAVDFLGPFLTTLEARARDAGVDAGIETVCASIGALPFEDNSFDVLWSEGAVYNLGFERGIAAWRRLLKTGGILVVSELSWITNTRPDELQRHWEREYAEIDTVSGKIRTLETCGYSPLAHFVLPECCWLDNYYGPLRARFDDFLARHGNAAEARAIVEAEHEEIALYERYRQYLSYGMYIAKKVDA